MNILFITTRYPKSYQEPIVSGVVKNPFSASLALARAAHEVTVITDGDRSEQRDFEGVKVYSVGRGFLKGIVSAAFLDVKIARQFLALRSKKFDIIHIHSGNLLLLFLLKKLGAVDCPIVYTAHGTSTPELRANLGGSYSLKSILLRVNGWVQERIDALMWAHSDLLISASDYQIEEMNNVYGIPKEKVARVYNGVDGTRYSPGREEGLKRRERLGIPKDVPVILFVGRMARKKGIHLLIQGARMVMESCGGAVFVCVAGSTGRHLEYREEIMQALEREGLEGRFRIIEDVVEADLPSFYAMADVCVFPSLGYESLPTVIYEAMACGVPIITQGSWGTPEVLDEILLSEEELLDGTLISTLIATLKDASLRQRVREKYLQRAPHFYWDTIREKYESLYKIAIQHT